MGEMKRLLHSAILMLAIMVSSSVSFGASENYFDGVMAYVSGDYETALRILKPLAESGDDQAQFHLGFFYFEGKGSPHFPQDDREAVKWYRKAAEQGNAEAQEKLSAMYVLGRGVIQDDVLAYMWINIAASQGLTSAIKDRPSYVKVLTPTQIETAQRFARNFVARKSPSPQEEKNPKQVVREHDTKPKTSPPPKTGSTGSGFFVSKLGHVLTNEHVVRNCGSVTVGDNAKKQVSVTVVETDMRNDLALLRISTTKMASTETKSLIRKLGIELVPIASEGLLRSEDVELGESVLVAGYPYGEVFSDAIKVTGGMVSANRGMGDDTGQFQMDAAVQPGNSGGPIYDEKGSIVGVVISQLNKLKVAKAIGSLPENVNFGIKASAVRQFLTSSGLPTKWSSRSQSMSTKDLAKIAKNQTVMVVCNP
jgi:uncharacterized protein